MWRAISVVFLMLSILPGVAFAQVVAPSHEPGRSSAVTREYLVGEWETRNQEFGRNVEIIWTVRPDGSLAYHFIVDGASGGGSNGTWSLEGDVLTERWIRAFGTTATGTGRVERIDDNTLRLTILDNGHPEYTGKVRIYRRRGAPQIS